MTLRLATIFFFSIFCAGFVAPTIQANPVQQSEKNAPTAAELRMEYVALTLINKQRAKNNRAPLILNPLLVQAARTQSQWMARNNTVAHVDLHGRNVADRAQENGYLYYTILGENLAMNSGYPKPVQTAVDGWMKSKAHRDNVLLAEYTETGIGVCIEGDAIYFTQVFGNPPPLYPPE